MWEGIIFNWRGATRHGSGFFWDVPPVYTIGPLVTLLPGKTTRIGPYLSPGLALLHEPGLRSDTVRRAPSRVSASYVIQTRTRPGKPGPCPKNPRLLARTRSCSVTLGITTRRSAESHNHIRYPLEQSARGEPYRPRLAKRASLFQQHLARTILAPAYILAHTTRAQTKPPFLPMFARIQGGLLPPRTRAQETGVDPSYLRPPRMQPPALPTRAGPPPSRYGPVGSEGGFTV